MLVRRHSFSVLAAVALVALTGLLAACSVAAAPRSFFGVAPQTNLDDSDIDRMGKGGVGTLRIYVPWAVVDPSPAAGDYQWASIDAVVGDAARNGIEVLPFLFGTPDWVAKDLDGQRCGSQCILHAPRYGQALAAWKTFVGDAVKRYGPGGEFWLYGGPPPPGEPPPCPLPPLPCEVMGTSMEPLPIRAWQIWNEQNSPSFYQPKPSPKAYSKLLGEAAAAIRAEDPGADVILGGMAGLSGVRKATPASRYLAQLYRVKGAKQNFDGVAPHPYGAQFEGVTEQVDLIRREMKRAGDKRAEMWVTETGWGSKAGGHPLNVGRRGQAERLEQTYRYFNSRRGKLNVKTVVWFSFEDSRTSICEWCASSGLFARGLKAKPAWRAFTRLSGGS